MANEQSQNGRGEYPLNEITYAKGTTVNFEPWNLNIEQVKFGLW